MGRIQSILRDIEEILNSSDHSCSTRFRKLAAEYADICAAVAADLEECRKVIDSGAMPDAVKMNRSAEPPYTERVRILMFRQRDKWLNLCRIYELPLPAEFDMKTVNLLENSETAAMTDDQKELLFQWRSIARTGSSDEKIAVLRKLNALDSNTGAWKSLLLQHEKIWISEQLAKAKEALEQKKEEAVFHLYNSLISPELLQSVPKQELECFLPAVLHYRQLLLRKEAQGILDEMTKAYLAENLSMLTAVTEKWDALMTNPDFKPLEQDLLQVSEAKKYLEATKITREKARAASELSTALLHQLNSNASFMELQKTYYELKQISEIDPELENRFESQKKRYETELQRKNARRITYGILTAVVLIAGGASLIYFVQQHSAVRQTCIAMKKMIKDGNPEKVAGYYEDLQKKSPDLAKKSEILALKKEAEKCAEDRKEESEVFDSLLSSISKFLTADNVENPRLAELLKEAEKEKEDKSPEQQTKLLELQRKSALLLKELQNKRENDFIRRRDDLLNKLLRIEKQLSAGGKLQPEILFRELDRLDRENTTLCESAKVSANLRKSSRSDFDTAVRSLRQSIAAFKENEALLRTLKEPDSLAAYRDALAKIRVKAPSLASSFRNAEPEIRHADFLASLPLFDAASSVNQNELLGKLDGSGDPYCRDYSTALARKNSFANMKKNLADLRTVKLPEWKVYEVVIPAGREVCHFYVKNPSDIELERGPVRTGRAYKSLVMTIQLPGGKSGVLIFKLSKLESENYEMSLVQSPKLAGQNLKVRDFEVSPRLLQNLEKGNLQIAPQYQRFEQILTLLEKSGSQENMEYDILNLLRQLPSETGLHPLAKWFMIHSLLDVLAEGSGINRKFVSQLQSNMGIIAKSWLDPAAEDSVKYELSRNQRLAASGMMDKLLKSLEIVKELYYAAVRRKPVPAGIIYVQENGNPFRFHVFQPSGTEEYILILNERQGKKRYVTIPASVIAGGTLSPEALQKLTGGSLPVNGAVFFYPYTKTSCRESVGKLLADAKNEGLELLQYPDSLPPRTELLRAALKQNTGK